MSTPFVGEIRMVAMNFAPAGWAFCDGQVQSIADNPTLFTLIGTTYGGNGVTTFALPDLRGRVPLHQGNSGSGAHVIGEKGGTETVTLTTAQMPAHTHALSASTTVAQTAATRSALLASSSTFRFYGSGAPTAPMAAGAVSTLGSGLPHTNVAPYQAINFIISLFGIFPSQS